MEQLTSPHSRLLRTSQAARYLGVGTSKLRTLVAQGLPYVQDGPANSPWRFDVRDLDELIDRSKIRL